MNLPTQARESKPPCGGCGLPVEQWMGTIPFYLPDRDIKTTVWRCRECGTYTRDIDLDDPLLQRHFEVASYTDLSAEQRLRAIRTGYFEYLLSLLTDRLGRSLSGLRVLDFGCAYGHFLEHLRDLGALAEGVEVVRALRETARQRGLTVHASAPEPGSVMFDLVVAIDSLYYTNDPVTTLKHLRSLLTLDGHLLLRVTNRTWLLDLLHGAGMDLDRNRFGDAKYNFSIAGTVKLIHRAGFEVDEVIWLEKGKSDPRSHIRMYYKIAPLVCDYLSLRVSPGIVVMAHPSSRGTP